MTPIARKEKSQCLLKREQIPYLPTLPVIEDEDEVILQPSEEVGIRICCLFAVVASAFEKGDTVFKDYLREHDLTPHLTPDERKFLASNNPPRQSVIDFTWRSEALYLLMWASHLFDHLPLPRQEVESNDIISRVPKSDESPWPFIRNLQLRGIGEILDASDLIYRLHWAVRQAHVESKEAPAGLIPGVVQEWHHAINWLTCYENSAWDKVSTDT